MADDDIEAGGEDGIYRRYQKRRYRHKRVYYLLVPIVVLAAAVAWVTKDATDGLLLAAVGLLFAQTLILREIKDMLGYLSSMRRDEMRSRDAILKQLADLRRNFPGEG